jgi:hypothetical protein
LTPPGKSGFTLHMHDSSDRGNPSLAKIKIANVTKGELLDDLHRLNVNQFTIYNDPDHRSKDIKRVWRLK